MDRARIAISSLLGFEPKSYTRFSLTRRTDGDGSRVEMKLAENENDEEMGDVMADGMETQIEKPHNNHKPLCCLMTAVLLVLIGFLVGYLAFRGQTPGKSVSLPDQPTEASYTDDDDSDEFVATNEEKMSLSFSDIKKMLTDNLDSSQFLHDINKVSDTSNHETGSDGDLTITQYIRQEFLKNLDKHSVWTDTHYVTLQFNGASPNRVWIVGGGNPEEMQLGQQNPKVFCPYSATGNFTGKLVYANYGTKDDFKLLDSMSVPVNGSVVVVRAGKINFAEKVTNAENMKAGGVLIYPDPEDYNLDPDVAIFGHVCTLKVAVILLLD
ncbi:transferrin receptor protein 1-like [Chiloscyllium plagiosum]|uniref:transferrin receptor protein 1-like n=1 Tax=Chiloscyllium plagiosum TaxID=36176 RepID=UPI001CB7B60E|nr:transferrin receptor protein 1-like [Chiloscyllium plagiosum]